MSPNADNTVAMWVGGKINPNATNVPSPQSVKRKAVDEIAEVARKLSTAQKEERCIRDKLNPVVRNVRSMTTELIKQMVAGGKECFVYGDVAVTLKEEQMSAPTTDEMRSNLLAVDGMTEGMVESVMSVLKRTDRTVYRVVVSESDVHDNL
jgi:hypothetical protein